MVKAKQKIPQIEFVYSWVYDDLFRNSTDTKSFLKRIGEEYPSVKEIESARNYLEKRWKKQGNKFLKEFSKITGLKWKVDKMKVYLTGKGQPMSEPLTIYTACPRGRLFSILTHELTHQIQIQNDKKTKKWWDYLRKKYPKEERVTKNHIALYAILEQLHKNLKTKKDLDMEKRFIKRVSPLYYKAQEIVEKEGAENIIKKFRELTK